MSEPTTAAAAPSAAKPLSFSERTADSRTRTYRVVHSTRYTYDAPVTSSYGRCYLAPRDLPEQRVLEHAIEVDPEPSDRSEGVDAFGNTDTFFHVTTPHTVLAVTGTSLVEVDPLDATITGEGAAVAPWELARPAGAAGAAATQYRLDLEPPEIDDAVREYAAAIFTPGKPLVEAVRDLTTGIYTDFRYHSGSTSVSTRVGTVMQRREGVCQDFARVAIACLRSRGLAARYVSGYLATEPPPGQDRVVGAGATHAWAAVWMPGGKWLPFDPTNNKFVDERHVTVAWGRDYEDVPPLRGVVYTESRQSRIAVSVDVAPVA
ncbi:transglutaminase family protein [Tsukamurella sp. 8F]|uniref:transglutaminase family protein n=1 Tax=unclassified Tsukamurella TaxID=2633480 RepID=UPI0023B9AFC7|nr:MULTISPECIES: transglutaminase family protein [unclassified Tsukamurella]MDF0529171.1 transglutaminase family protein [Tsukamurella sp. 8J]MDF0585356.1 transglutaminase family protein [Tsukamurella sp. 8F]